MKDASAASVLTNKCGHNLWRCSNPFPLTCVRHGEEITVRCGRWRTCSGCALYKQWCLSQRFLTGIEHVPDGKVAMFVTLTFPRHRAPDEDAAHRALRSLVGRLRYRGRLGAYGWVLQRQKPRGEDLSGPLHYHGIWHVRPFPRSDNLAEWRELVQASGFGVQNRIEAAVPEHAHYVCRYISRRMASLAPLRRAYGFSRDFPRTEFEEQRRWHAIDARAGGSDQQPPTAAELEELAAGFGIEPEDSCAWVPSRDVWR